MADRGYPRTWTRLLPAESARWVEQGLISAEQREQILRLYPVQEDAGRERLVLIFSILGSLLLGAGVILFFAANWFRLPAVVKVLMIMTAVVAAHGTGYYLWFVRGTHPRVGHSLIFLGCLLYGAGIWLIGQIFHLGGSWPAGFLLWAVGVLPVAWAISSLPVLILGTALLMVWTVGVQEAAHSANYLYPLLLVGTVWPLARRLGTSLVEAGALVSLFLWFAINVAEHGGMEVVGYEPVLMARLLLLYGTALVLGGLADAGPERAWLGTGGLFTLLAAYVLTFSLGRVTNEPMPGLVWGSPLVMAGTGLLLGANLLFGLRCWRLGGPERMAALPAVAVLAGAAAALHLMGQELRMILFNLLLFGSTAGWVVLGIRRQSELLVNLGLGAFMIHLLTRYVDLFFPAMDRSLFFVLGGLLLLVIGWLLERNRRRWVGDWFRNGRTGPGDDSGGSGRGGGESA